MLYHYWFSSTILSPLPPSFSLFSFFVGSTPGLLGLLVFFFLFPGLICLYNVWYWLCVFSNTPELQNYSKLCHIRCFGKIYLNSLPMDLLLETTPYKPQSYYLSLTFRSPMVCGSVLTQARLWSSRLVLLIWVSLFILHQSSRDQNIQFFYKLCEDPLGACPPIICKGEEGARSLLPPLLLQLFCILGLWLCGLGIVCLGLFSLLGLPTAWSIGY